MKPVWCKKPVAATDTASDPVWPFLQQRKFAQSTQKLPNYVQMLPNTRRVNRKKLPNAFKFLQIGKNRQIWSRWSCCLFINRFSEKIKFLLIKIIHIFSLFYIYEVKSNEIVIFRVFTLISNWLTSHFWDTSFKTFHFCCQYFDFAF